MLTGLGRRLMDACSHCQEFGIESVADGHMVTRCDRGEISHCLKSFSTIDRPAGYA